MKIDQEAVEDYGLLLLKLKMFPYFEIAHYILMCLAVREDITLHQPAIPNFHKRHPLSCYLSSMLLCFGGGMVAHLILGEPLLADFKSHQGLALASLCWYLVFFSPFDMVYKLTKVVPVKIVLSVLKEVLRARKVYDGVAHALHIYPNSYVIVVLVGCMKGAGSGFLVIFDRFNRGFYMPNAGEVLQPTFASKACFIASILFTLERKSMLPALTRNILFFCVVVFICYVKVMSIFLKSFDPFVPFENLTAAVFFGGIMDAFRKARAAKATPEATGNKVATTEAKKTD